MIGQYLITFREGLEAALITSLILAFLARSDNKALSRFVWIGVALALGVSLVSGLVIAVAFGGLDEASTKLFEGVAALIAVAVLTSMILWMATKGGNIKAKIDEKVEKAIRTKTSLSLLGLGFIVVFREGLETVLFLTPFGTTDPGGTFIGATFGLITTLMISFLIYSVGLKIDLKRFFYLTSILLILLAAGLAGYGIHELLEYQEEVGGEVGWLGTFAYQLNIGKDSIWHQDGAIGSIFAVMFGFSVKMEWARVLVHTVYLAIFLPLTVLAYQRPDGWFIKRGSGIVSFFKAKVSGCTEA